MIGNPLKDTFLRYLVFSLSFVEDGEGDLGGEDTGVTDTGSEEGDQGNWYDSLSDEYKGNENITKYKTQDEFVKSSLEAKRLVGKKEIINGIIKPDENSTDEEITKFYTELGRPETAEGYEVGEVKDMPEGLVVDDNIVAGMKESAHSLGLSKEQFAGIYNTYMDQTKEMFIELQETLKKQDDDARTELRGEWGSSFDRKKGLVDRVIDTYGGKKEQVDYIKANFGSDPVLMRMLGNLGDSIAEDTLKTGDLGGKISNVEAQIKAIRNDLNHPYNIKKHPGHRDAVAEMQTLYNKAEESA